MKTLKEAMKGSLEDLLAPEGLDCGCGIIHKAPVRTVEIGEGVLERLPAMAGAFNIKRPVLVADPNTWEAAGGQVFALLREAGLNPARCILSSPRLEPDEYWAGKLLLYWKKGWDGIIAVGSGSINDLCKVLAAAVDLPFIIAATAPSMDGFASTSASILLDGLKQSLPAPCAGGIVADSSIMAKAPMPMLQAGLGDMVAKYVSVCEWRISSMVTGEYYCEEVARLIRNTLARCINAAEGLIRRDPKAAGDIAEGLIVSGAAMSFAGISRPASGVEHYFSHVWDMRAILKGKKPDLHGIQVGVGTILALKIYDYIKNIKPDEERARRSLEMFDQAAWRRQAEKVFSHIDDDFSASRLRWLRVDAKDRLPRIIANWDTIIAIIREELPDREELERLLRLLGAPLTPDDIGISAGEVREAFIATKDIRQKYVASTLLSDLGLLEEAADKLVGLY
jgi:glycerol-1-phosphate dehydrogenase [NAD(P)+]